MKDTDSLGPRQEFAAAVAAALTGRRARPMPGGNFLVPCVAHDDRHPSLSIKDGDDGLLVHCWSGCNARDVYAALRKRGLLSDNTRRRSPPARPAPVTEIAHEHRQQEKARWHWGQRRPIAGSIAEVYLRKARGYIGLLPPTLGFLPPLKRENHPAMVAAFAMADEIEPGVLGVPRDVGAVHLTLLKPDGSGKADAKPDRLTLGRPLARPVVLAPVGDLLGLAITEGIEDALSAHAATGLGAWAAGSASFLPALAETVPDYVEAVTIFAHADEAGRRGALRLAERLHQRGIEVMIEGAV